MKMVCKEIIILILASVPFSVRSQVSDFAKWLKDVTVIKEGQPVQDSLFLCLCLPCDMPDAVEKQIQQLSCFQEKPLGFNGRYSPYCIGNANRLLVSPLDTGLVAISFYIEADRDFTKSLVLAIFNSAGTEVSAKVIASDDAVFFANKESMKDSTLRLFQYLLGQGILFVRECCYDRNLHLVDLKTSAFSIAHDGIIKQIDQPTPVSLKKLFAPFTIEDNWMVE